MNDVYVFRVQMMLSYTYTATAREKGTVSIYIQGKGCYERYYERYSTV